jgi:hypothetical protein
MSSEIKLGQGAKVLVEDGDEAGMLVASDRAKRNMLLADTDMYLIDDFPVSTPKLTKWKTYRQELRDMDFSDPDNITWPEKPE